MSANTPAQSRTGTLPWVWGEPTPAGLATQEDRHRTAVRAVATTASAERLFLWLCQLRRAPYSYDWVDNFGRRSPRQADPALCQLKIGQTVMTIFTVTDFEPGASLTVRMNRGWPRRTFGDLCLRYRIDRLGAERTLLSAVMWMPPIGRALGRQRRYLLAWGDLIMMRKQLLVLRELAERGDVG